MASFSIISENPDIHMSDAICCRDTAAMPAGWDPSNPLPPPPGFLDPYYRFESWVWVQVHQEGVVSGQTAALFLYAGTDAMTYESDKIRDPQNQFTPAYTWTKLQWQEQFLAGKVCRIPWFDGISTQDSCPISDPAYQPGDTGSRWYQFWWEEHLVPPYSFCFGMNTALLASVEDSAVVGVTDFTLEGNNGFAQRNCLVN